MNEDTKETLAVVGIVVGGLVAMVLLALTILMFYGAVFGAIGAGAFWAFKALTSLIGA